MMKNRRLPKLALRCLLLACSLCCNAPQAYANDSEKTYTHYSEWLTASEMQRVPHPYNLDFSSKPRWSYVMGIELESFLDTWLTYGNSQIMDYLKEYPEKMIDSEGNITGYKYSDFNLDNVRTGRFILRMYNLQPTQKDSLAIATLFKQLENQPRTKEGVWWHKEIYAWQVWLDGIYMGLPFYTMAAPQLRPGQQTDYYNDAVDQITKTDQRTYDASTQLWKHAWDETHSIFWANPETGLSQHTWARALGWFTMAMVEILDVLPANYERRGEVEELFRKAMTSVVEYQQQQSGVWYDVLDVTDCIEEAAIAQWHRLLPAPRDRKLSASFNMFVLLTRNGYARSEHTDRCWRNIKSLRMSSLFNRNVRLKNKLGILASLPGRRFLHFIALTLGKYLS